MLKVDAAWRPDYVGTEQERFIRFDNGKLFLVLHRTRYADPATR
jgi:hypothetical protein